MFRERLHDLWLRLKALVKRRQLDRDLAEELEFHLRMREQKLIEQGLSPHQAHSAARRGFGNATLLKETSRGLWSFPSLESWLQDFRYGLRQLRRNPGFTIVAILTLALGIGANTAIFSVVYAVLLRPLPYPSPGQLVRVFEANDHAGIPASGCSYREFQDWQRQNHVFSGMAAVGAHELNLKVF